ncbi:hypothetical protein L6452_29066 [Arctium lappa]|uniref:Uncharacterized protein n=1 Tax=Arctium lappa TaxID=4217 RepID=A0ACB8ZH44_ARCLA|nr:hypothetical protein L6452_29066 [Arctium lappa]
MMNEHWVDAAISSDVLVAELLLRLKQSPSPNSSHALPPPTTTTTTTALLNPIGWGDRKSRSKPSTISTVAVINEFGKGQQQRSPSTPLSWSGGGGTSTSDGYDEYSRPSDLSSGDRSTKIDLQQNHKRDDNGFVQVLCKVESEMKIEERRFVLPDLNETPACEGLAES